MFLLSVFGSSSAYVFGVELELIGTPLKYRARLQKHYQDLAAALNNNLIDTVALADALDRPFRKHPEHYDKWWITKDGSLGTPAAPQVALEAVSPTLASDAHWVDELEAFWRAWRQVFLPLPRRTRGSTHVHVSPRPRRAFSLAQLRQIAFGVVVYEPLVVELLPWFRRQNRYCTPNTQRSLFLRRLAAQEPHLGARCGRLWRELQAVAHADQLCDFMQLSDAHPRNNKRVLWNFHNTRPGGTGSVEFRGAPATANPVETAIWVLFSLAFVDVCIAQTARRWEDFPRPSMRAFWSSIRQSARRLCTDVDLPVHWGDMPSSGAQMTVRLPSLWAGGFPGMGYVDDGDDWDKDDDKLEGKDEHRRGVGPR